MTLSQFAESYFAFLLSGRVEDFKQASDLLHAALSEGVPMTVLQESMDESHMTAEVMCLVVDNAPLTKLD
jgi:hypothetical protein